ncbi:uncharacterized protein LOC112091248 [Morus notabilis]|uniref:uncharacterized protein LOC112091248 n=1 Tax=Morus notabilis TaxID=981085 RepID=UPI000CED3F04|nr:uncharacterized protein LOC112091248 [Morus notabilis]
MSSIHKSDSSTHVPSATPGPSCSSHVPEPVLETPNEPQEKPDFALENVRFGKGNVFTRRTKAIPKPMQVQESNSNPSNEVTISSHFLQDKTELHVDNDDQDLPIAIRKGTRECTKRPLHPLAHFLSFNNFSPSHKAFVVSLNTITIPTTLSEALSNEKWKQAMNVEMEALKKNKTWELVKLSEGKRPRKRFRWRFHQDGKNLTAHTVCRLKKALYGLKQSPRAWFGRFAKVMLATGYKQKQGDHPLFIKHSPSGGVAALLVYVDDIILTRDDVREKQVLSQHLAKQFEIKALGRFKYFLGIEVAHSKQGIFFSQQKYVTDLLKETGKTACKPTSTPIYLNFKLGKEEEDAAVNREMYQHLVGRLIYLSHT